MVKSVNDSEVQRMGEEWTLNARLVHDSMGTVKCQIKVGGMKAANPDGFSFEPDFCLLANVSAPSS